MTVLVVLLGRVLSLFTSEQPPLFVFVVWQPITYLSTIDDKNVAYSRRYSLTLNFLRLHSPCWPDIIQSLSSVLSWLEHRVNSIFNLWLERRFRVYVVLNVPGSSPKLTIKFYKYISPRTVSICSLFCLLVLHTGHKSTEARWIRWKRLATFHEERTCKL